MMTLKNSSDYMKWSDKKPLIRFYFFRKEIVLRAAGLAMLGFLWIYFWLLDSFVSNMHNC